jgi:hypothetical protein
MGLLACALVLGASLVLLIARGNDGAMASLPSSGMKLMSTSVSPVGSAADPPARVAAAVPAAQGVNESAANRTNLSTK